MLDAGATVVLGHHPHVLQPVVSRDRRLLAYSLGNLVAGPRGRLAREAALITMTLDRAGLVAWEATPLLMRHGRPAPAPELVAVAVRARLSAPVTAAAGRGGRAH
jgi:poly-gamma-glutamate synthesis protein (capsule biosynthesis protein)